MKINKVIVIIFLFIAVFVLTGCQLMEFQNIKDVKEVLEKYNNNLDLDMDYSSFMQSSEFSRYESSKVIIKTNDNNQNVFIEIKETSENIKMYYVNGYLCTINDDKYIVSNAGEYKANYENPLPTDIDLNNLKFKLHTEELEEQTVYTIDTDDNDAKLYVEEIIGIDISNMKFNMKIDLTVDKETNDLLSMKVNINVVKEEETIEVQLLGTINAIGDDVNLIIPTEVDMKIKEYIDLNLNQELNPQQINYENTNDGVVKYHNLGVFKKVVFDKTTEKLIVLRNNYIEIYNSSTMVLERKITSLLTPVCIDVDNGKLVVGYMTKQIKIYDLVQNTESTIDTSINVFEIVIDGDIVIYTDKDQSSYLVFHNIVTNNKIGSGPVYKPLLTINRKDHILYVTETGLLSSELQYYNSQTGEKFYSSQFSQFSKVTNRIIFDGKYIHHEGKSLDSINASVISSSYLNKIYSNFNDFISDITLFDSDEIAFVGSNMNQNKIAIFDNINNNFIYDFSLIMGSIIEMNDGKYLGVCGNMDSVAVIDVNLIKEDLINDNINELPNEIITEEDDGKIKTLMSTIYTKSVADENYIYTLNENSYELNVYNIETLKKAFSTRFLVKPVSMDAFSGKLVIGFGDALQFRIFNTSTWEYEIINTTEKVFSTVIFQDKIIYAPNDQHCNVMVYNMTNDTHTYLGYQGYYVSMAINRQSGILYFGDKFSNDSKLTYYNLISNNILFSKSVYLSNTEVRFDGNFIHYHNSTYDRGGQLISHSDLARDYQNSNDLIYKKTIYDDNLISIFTAVQNEEIVTVIYDLTTNTQLYSYSGKGTHAYKTENTVVILDDLSDIIITISLS